VGRPVGQPAVIMRDNLYAGYRRIADPDGSEAQAAAVLPLSVDNDAPHPRLDLDAGGS
jgi:hypothetical protein